jgi:hypothetical protein
MVVVIAAEIGRCYAGDGMALQSCVCMARLWYCHMPVAWYEAPGNDKIWQGIAGIVNHFDSTDKARFGRFGRESGDK